MDGRERELCAIAHRVPDRIPVDAIHVENTEALAAHLGIAPDGVLAELGLDGRLVGLAYAGEKRTSEAGEPLSEWGSAGLLDYGTSHVYPLAAASSLAEIAHYRWPDPQDYDYEGAARAAQAFGGVYAVRGPYWQPLFCRVCSLLGMEEALVRMVAEPRLFEGLLEHVFERVHELCRRYLAACGEHLHIFCLGDDFATQRGLMFRPELWRRYLKPRYARLFDLGRRAGKPVWFHSCGDVTAVLPDLIDIGMDAWETVQLHTLPLTPQELKREYGRHIAFFGGVNTQRLPFASPGEVAEEVQQCIEALGEGGGYICGPDHHVKPDVSAENALTLFRTATSFRRPGYTTRL